MTEEQIRELFHSGTPAPPAQVAQAPLAKIRGRARSRGRVKAGTSVLAISAVLAAGVTFLDFDRQLSPAQSWCGDPGYSPPSSAEPKMTAGPPSAKAGRLTALMQEAYLIGDVKYPDFFAGAEVDMAADRVTVWRKPSAAFDRELSQLRGSEKLVVHCAEHSINELHYLGNTLIADAQYWTDQGLTLHQFWGRSDGSCVEVQTEDPVRAERELGLRYPGQPLCFTNIQ